MTTPDQTQPLAGRRIAVPESRELNLFAGMLEARGCEVYRCPLVSIHDSTDTESVEQWLLDFSAGDFDDLILLTGEGLRRLLGFAERAGDSLQRNFIDALGRTRKIVRGPKPGNALRRIGLKADVHATAPTTEGVIEALANEHLQNRKIGVQLYGTNPNLPLMDFLQAKGAAVHPVAPYIYADDSDDEKVIELISLIEQQSIDAIAFTSAPQVKRLFQIARRLGRGEVLRNALNNSLVAAVGPVVASCLGEYGVEVKIMPESTYFMKPLVRALVRAFE